MGISTVGVLGMVVGRWATYYMMRPQQETDGTKNWVTEESDEAGGWRREASVLARTGRYSIP